MQGKVLADGLIAGNDGNRYTYTASDLKNAQGKSVNAIIGSEVDFNGADGKASDIYITKQSFDLQHRLFDGDLQSVKFKVYAAAGCCLLALIPFVGVAFLLLAIVLLLLVVVSVQKGSQSTTLLKNFVLSIIIPFVGGIIITIVTAVSMAGNALAIYQTGDVGVMNAVFGGVGVVGIIIGIIVMLSCWVFMYRYYKELTYITNDNLFFYAFICRLIGSFLSIVPLISFIGGVFLLADLVVEAIAWFRVKEIRKSYSAIA